MRRWVTGALVALAAGTASASGQSAEASGPIEFQVDETLVRGYAAGPMDAEAAVLVVHDWFGLSDAIRASVDRFAEMGYRAFAVDLYHGEYATDHAKAGALMGALKPADVEADLRAAVGYLAEGGRSVASVGFSMGGAPALNAAYLVPGVVKAVVNIYGGGAEGLVGRHDRRLPAPFLFITGSDDAWPMGTLRTLMGDQGPEGHMLQVLVYPGARHGYAQPLYADGANLDADATQATWDLVVPFLEKHLGGG